MMDSLKNKIVKLENNKEYFVLETLIDNNINYMLLLNLVDDKEIKIVKMILDNDEEYFVEITDDKELTSLKSRFKDILDELAAKRDCKIDYLFLVRCILGAQYTDINHSFSDYKNCIIRILNSSIDVDKLDYISRDSSISGFANTKVDTKRLLSSLIFVKSKGLSDKPKLCLAFKKTALGVIQNVVTSRNSLYTWVYSHHKVKYEGDLIQKAIELIADEEEKQSNHKMNRNIFITSLFSVKSIE